MKYTFENEKLLENVVYLANGEYNDLSPFKINTLEMDKQVLKNKYLKSKDLVASLDNLKFPKSLIDINFISSLSQLSYSLFYKTKSYISLQYSEDEIELNNPANVKDIFDGLKSFTGYLPVKSLDIDLQLSLNETIFLLGSIDLQRKNNFIQLSNNKEFEKTTLDFEKVFNFIKQKDLSQNDFLYYFERLISLEDLKKDIFENLINKNLINNNKLNDNLFYISANTLINNSFLHLKNILKNKETGTLLETFFIQYGLNEILQFSFSNNKIKITSVSSLGMYAWIESLIENQSEILKNLESKTNAKVKKEVNTSNLKEGYCPNCGAYYENLPNFCGKCGQKLN